MRKARASEPDYFLIVLVFLLTLFGLVMLASASSDLGAIKFNDSYYYLKHQILYGLSLGLVGFVFASKFYYRQWLKLAFWLLLASVALLIMVFTPLGFSAGGADRWVQLGPITFQPAEIVKFAFLVYLAAWLSSRPERSSSLSKGFLPFLIICGAIAGLLLAQPSTTTVVLIGFSSLAMYWLSGARLSYILSAVLIAAIGLAAIIYLTPYRLQRIQTFLNPSKDQTGSGYHINQALIAIGSGGLWGAGYGQSTTKFNYLPEPIGDSIFAVIAEELGFVGASGLLIIYVLFLYKCFKLIHKTRDLFARLLICGFASLIGLQVFINIGAISGLLPLTGVPLPFISYGGTALAIFLTMSGVIVNISKYERN